MVVGSLAAKQMWRGAGTERMIELMADVGVARQPAGGALLGALAALSAVCGSADGQELATVGSAIAVKGKVTVVSHGEMTPKRLAAGDVLYEGDHIETNKNARLQLGLEDGSTVQVGSSSALDLEWVLYAPALVSRNVILSVPDGVIRFIVESLVARSSFEVKTQTAVTTVQGTDWIVAAHPESTSVLVIDGEVLVENVRPDVVGSTILKSGTGTSVTSGQAPDPAASWPQERRTAFIRRTMAP